MKYMIEVDVQKDIPEEQLKKWVESKLYSEFFPELVNADVKVTNCDKAFDTGDIRRHTIRAFQIALDYLVQNISTQEAIDMQQVQFEVVKILDRQQELHWLSIREATEEDREVYGDIDTMWEGTLPEEDSVVMVWDGTQWGLDRFYDGYFENVGDDVEAWMPLPDPLKKIGE